MKKVREPYTESQNDAIFLKMSNSSFFVISLDFELYWGMFDKVSLKEYGAHIAGVHTAIPEMLALFRAHEIHATWATVGMLICEHKEELVALLPPEELQPTYDNPLLSSYMHLKRSAVGRNAEEDPFHYGAHLVNMILATPNQELGSHTFSHYYSIDGSKNGKAIFAADCDAFRKASQKFGVPITSIVFPRNQATQEALEVCREAGFSAYRGTPKHFLYTGKAEKAQVNPLLRLLRLLDAYVNISGHHTFTRARVQEEILQNVMGSRFLRPYSRTLRFFERLRIQRIKNSMTYAAKHGEIFHLWWHPHNFGINRKENLANLATILEHYEYLKRTYTMQSASMREVATLASE